MAQPPRQLHAPFAWLNSDGRRHPVTNSLVAVTVMLGILAFCTGFFPGLHLLSSWSGLIGILTGASGQMISATTEERFPLVVGMGAAGVGFLLGMAHGGLFGGVLG